MDPEYNLQDVVRCHLCDTPDPKLHCEICRIKLCKACAGEHLLDESKEHKVLPIRKGKSTLKSPKCLKHPTKQFELYCKQCDVPMCVHCASSREHRGHKIINIFENYPNKREVLQKDLQEFENYIYPKYEDTATDIKNHIADLKRNTQKLVNSLHLQGEDLHREIDIIVKKQTSYVDKMESKYLANLKKQENEIINSISEIEFIIDHLKKILESNDVHSAFEYKSRNDEFRRLPPISKEFLPSFSPYKINTEQLTKQFGSLTSVDEMNPIEFPTAESNSSNRSLMDVPQIISTVNTGNLQIKSVSCLWDEKIWTCSDDKFMKLYDLKKNFVKTIETKSGKTPWDIAVTKNGHLVYTDPNDRSINIVNNTIVEEIIRLQEWKPLNICVSSSGDFLVVLLSDKKKSKVVRYSGSTEKQVIQFNEEGKSLFSHGYNTMFISENKNLDICVADCLASAVVVVNKIGYFRFKYIGLPFIRPFNPIGIATDSHSCILIADRFSRCIHILDKDGLFLNCICNCLLSSPYSLCVDTKDNLFVVDNYAGKVKKVKYYM